MNNRFIIITLFEIPGQAGNDGKNQAGNDGKNQAGNDGRSQAGNDGIVMADLIGHLFLFPRRQEHASDGEEKQKDQGNG